MIDSLEINIKLKGEALDCVLEYTYIERLLSFRENSGKEIKKKEPNDLEQVQEPWVYIGQQIPKTGEKAVFECYMLLALLYGTQTWSLTRKEKRMFRNYQRKVEQIIL
jgi:hypothetical protein